MSFPIRVRGYSRRGFRVDGNQRVSYGTADAVVDLDNLQSRRVLDTEKGNFFSPPEFTFSLFRAGGLTTATTASGLNIVVPRALVLKNVVATVGTAPTGATLIVDVKKIPAGGNTTDAGTTVFTTGTRRPTIAINGTISTLDATNGVPQVTAFAAGDIARVEIAQVGSTVAGSDLRVRLRFDLV